MYELNNTNHVLPLNNKLIKIELTKTSRWNDNKITMAHYKLNRSENLFSAH